MPDDACVDTPLELAKFADFLPDGGSLTVVRLTRRISSSSSQTAGTKVGIKWHANMLKHNRLVVEDVAEQGLLGRWNAKRGVFSSVLNSNSVDGNEENHNQEDCWKIDYGDRLVLANGQHSVEKMREQIATAAALRLVFWRGRGRDRHQQIRGRPDSLPLGEEVSVGRYVCNVVVAGAVEGVKRNVAAGGETKEKSPLKWLLEQELSAPVVAEIAASGDAADFSNNYPLKIRVHLNCLLLGYWRKSTGLAFAKLWRLAGQKLGPMGLALPECLAGRVENVVEAAIVDEAEDLQLGKTVEGATAEKETPTPEGGTSTDGSDRVVSTPTVKDATRSSSRRMSTANEAGAAQQHPAPDEATEQTAQQTPQPEEKSTAPKTPPTEQPKTPSAVLRCRGCRVILAFDRHVAHSHGLLTEEETITPEETVAPQGTGPDPASGGKEEEEEEDPYAYSYNNQYGSCSSSGTPTASSAFFIEPLSWMAKQIHAGGKQGKLACERCKAKLGNWNWVGCQCSCGEWISPAFQLHRDKVDMERREGA